MYFFSHGQLKKGLKMADTKSIFIKKIVIVISIHSKNIIFHDDYDFIC